ncbi:hypothetical protein N185_32520 [Sinorhizobium sp. GW3]|nr:hypothetical protein N185_32520 [Sinorhizobium sp. GW3]
MKKPSSRIREEIAKLQEQLKHAETREAERIGRIALKAGLGEIEIEEADLQKPFEDMAKHFRGGKVGSNGKGRAGVGVAATTESATVSAGATSGSGHEA